MTNANEGQPRQITLTLPEKGNVARKAGLVATGAVAMALVMSNFGVGRPATAGGAESSPTPSPTSTLVDGKTPTPNDAAGATSKPENDANTINFGDVTFTGVPEKVDPKNVDQANHKPFKNTIGLGSQMAIGEPGGLLVGPDFGYTGKENPFGQNSKGWESMYESGGSINPFSPVTQEVLHYEGPAFQNLPEGGFMFASAGQMDVEIGDVKISLPKKDNNNYFLIVRGMFGDNKQNTDKNQTATFTNFVPGHTLVEMYESRDETNLAFISEGQFKQMAETSHSGGTNLGDGGASELTVVFVDMNTGAVDVIQQELGRNTDASKNWELVGSNWFTK